MDSLETEWSTEATAARRDTYYAASQRKFVPFREPMVFRKGSMQYLWDVEGKKYTDLLGMNVCISVGHSHPKVVAAAMAQAQDLTTAPPCSIIRCRRISPRNWPPPCRRAMTGWCTSPTQGPRPLTSPW